MTEGDVVPEYREVTGRYMDKYNRMLEIQDPDLYFVNGYRFRVGVRQLEELARKDKMQNIRDEDIIELMRRELNVEISQFCFSPIEVVGLLDHIRNRLLEKINLVELSQRLTNEQSNEDHFKKHFPRISKSVLETFVKRIAHKYIDLPIETITLYRYHSNYFSGVKTKYAVVIEVVPSIKSDSKLSQRFHDLQYATGWMATVPDPDSSKDLGIDDGFSDVYVDKPEREYLKEWAFYAKYTDDPMPLGIMTDEEQFILFKSDKYSTQPSVSC